MSAISTERYVESSNAGNVPERELEDQKLRLKIKELIDKVLAPPELSQEDLIKVQLKLASTTRQKFPLLIELFKIKVAALKQAGLSPQTCLEEFDQAGTFLTGENSDLKNEVAVLYERVSKTGKDIFVNEQDCWISFDLGKLQEETGVSFFDKDFLNTSAELYVKLFKQKFPNKSAAWVFYEITLQPNFHKILDYLEKEGDLDRIQKVFNLYISCLTPEFDVWKNFCKRWDPITKALPYIAKYGSLDQVEALHQLRSEPSWERASHWIELQCQAAEILAPTNREKAQQYLAKAEKDLQEKFVISFWFSSDRDKSKCEQHRKEASARIEKTKAGNNG